MKKYLLALTLVSTLVATSLVAKPVKLTGDSDMQAFLGTYKGKVITLKLTSGTEVTGKVAEVNDTLIHILRLQGMEFYDAVVSINNVQAVVIRTKD